jgi:hypothetical protein
MTTSPRKNVPDNIMIAGEPHRLEKILKHDFFSINVLYRNERNQGHVLKISQFRGTLGVFLRPLAVVMSRREYRLYRQLAGVPGIPALGPRYGNRGFFHQYVEGRTLFELPKGCPLPEQFWRDLGATLESIHRRRIVHLDLHKLGNIILGDDGRAYILDFQIAFMFRRRSGWIGARIDTLFEWLKREDLYRVYKHKRRFQGAAMTEDERRWGQRSVANQWFFRFIGEPYRKIKRLIYPKGSNETLWYKWKKGRSHDRQIP